MTPKKLESFLMRVIPEKRNVLIVSPPGCGKTSIVKQVTEKLNANLVTMFPAISDPTDAKGFPWVLDGKPQFLPFNDLQKLIDAEKLTVCLLDDMGQAPTSVQASFMQLIYSRTVNDIPISDHVCFIAATNRKEDKAGVTGLIEPVKSRFCTIINLDVSVDDWLEWGFQNNIHPDVMSFVQNFPGKLSDFKATTELTNSPCPRTIEHLSFLHSKMFDEEIMFEAYSGAVGEGLAREFMSYLSKRDVMPNLKKLMENPTKDLLPSEPSLLYVLIGQIAQRANTKNIEQILKIADIMPEEFAVMMVSRCKAMNQELISNTHVLMWLQNKKAIGYEEEI